MRATKLVNSCLCSLPSRPVYSTSIAAQILPIGLLGAAVYYREGNLSIRDALFIAAGLFVGFLFGALFANQPFISSALMKKLYGIFLFVIGARYLFFR